MKSRNNSHHKTLFFSWAWEYTPSTPLFQRQKREALCEFKDTPIHIETGQSGLCRDTMYPKTNKQITYFCSKMIHFPSRNLDGSPTQVSCHIKPNNQDAIILNHYLQAYIETSYKRRPQPVEDPAGINVGHNPRRVKNGNPV